MTLSEKDAQMLWHPYTQHQTSGLFPAIVKAKNEFIWDDNGNKYIDAISSWWANPFGHGNKVIAKAIYQQLQQLDHVLFGGFTHQPAVQLAENLLALLPDNQSKIFFSDNGSTAVEIAIKASLQYFYNQSKQRHQIIAFENAFHGDTFGAMAVSGIGLFTQAFSEMLLPVIRIPVPTEANFEQVLNQFTQQVATNNVAAFIFEPLVLGAAGMQMYKPEHLDQLIQVAKQYQTITIADEIMTGFGKTGKIFASNYLTQKPDIFCLSKALTGGTIPMSATTFSDTIFEGFLSADVNKALFHGHTFTANPTGCAAALAAIRVLQTPEMQQNIHNLNQSHKAFAEKISQHPNVKNVRILGTILAFELNSTQTDYYGEFRNILYNHAISQGVVLRPIGNTLYILPPYTITHNALRKIYKVTEQLINLNL